MLAAIYIEALLFDEELADQVWEAWDAGLIPDDLAAVAWCILVTPIDAGICEVRLMSRQVVTDAELTQMINDRFRSCKELDGDCRDVKIGGVQLHAAPDATGCNWDASIYNGPEACKDVFRTVIEEFRCQYNLAED
jgi:hypothetical protein